MNICLFSQNEFNQPLPLKDERAKHIVKVLHKKTGDSFSAGIINGAAGTCIITNISDDFLEYSFTPSTEVKPLHPLKMIIGFPRPIQLKRLLRDIAALGVQEVHLTGTELGEKSYMDSGLSEHDASYQMLIDGTVQAASTYVPELFIHKTLSECLNFIKNSESYDASLRICLDNVNPSGSLMSVLTKNKSDSTTTFIAAIGSERGWTNNERALLEKYGYIRSGMGNRVMRTETAATVSASIISAVNGWLE